MNSSSSTQVKMYKLGNRLKRKLGMQVRENEDGEIDPKAIKEADTFVEELKEKCPAIMDDDLTQLVSKWNQMRDMPRSPEQEKIAEEIFTLAHEIKDLGAMCGHDLAAHFAESLRDYVVLTELKLEAQRVIIQAHVDALQVVMKQDLQDDTSEKAEELKKMVKIAIDKYS